MYKRIFPLCVKLLHCLCKCVPILLFSGLPQSSFRSTVDALFISLAESKFFFELQNGISRRFALYVSKVQRFKLDHLPILSQWTTSYLLLIPAVRFLRWYLVPILVSTRHSVLKSYKWKSEWERESRSIITPYAINTHNGHVYLMRILNASLTWGTRNIIKSSIVVVCSEWFSEQTTIVYKSSTPYLSVCSLWDTNWTDKYSLR
jgi:hypothetical protein